MGAIIGAGVALYGAMSANDNASQARELSQEEMNKQFAIQQQQLDLQNKYYNDWHTNFEPLQLEMAQQAKAAVSPAGYDVAAGQAGATAGQQNNVNRASMERNLENMGVDPNSGRFVGLDTQLANQGALNTAGQETLARNNQRQYATGLLGAAVGQGNTLMGAGNQMLSSAGYTGMNGMYAANNELNQANQEAQNIGAFAKDIPNLVTQGQNAWQKLMGLGSPATPGGKVDFNNTPAMPDLSQPFSSGGLGGFNPGEGSSGTFNTSGADQVGGLGGAIGNYLNGSMSGAFPSSGTNNMFAPRADQSFAPVD